jgi:hypothetical protein
VRRLASVLACAALLSLFAPVSTLAEDVSIPGHAVLARASGEALVIWDATPLIASVVQGKLSDADANSLVAHDALRILARMQPNVDKSAKSITVRVIYNKTGEVSPVYGAATFAGVERYATLTAPAAALRTDKSKWKELDDKTALPAWLVFTVIGKLPPR